MCPLFIVPSRAAVVTSARLLVCVTIVRPIMLNISLTKNSKMSNGSNSLGAYHRYVYPLKIKKPPTDFDAKPKLNGHLSSCQRTCRKSIKRQFKRPKNFKNAPAAVVPKERSLQPAFEKYDRQLLIGNCPVVLRLHGTFSMVRHGMIVLD